MDVQHRSEIAARPGALDAREEHALELERLCRRLGAAPRAPIWREVREPYVFEASRGFVSLADLFRGRRQLVVRHLLLGCGHADICDGCADLERRVAALSLRIERPDLTAVAVSLATLPEIERYRRRMGWDIDWLVCSRRFEDAYHERAAAGGRVQRDARPGASVFFRDAHGTVFHTLSCYARSVEVMIGVAELWPTPASSSDHAAEVPHSG